MSRNVELKAACTEFQESLEQLDIGVVDVKDSVSIEQNILQLKEITDFLKSKLNVINVSDVPAKQKNYENINIESEKEKLFNSTIQSEINDSTLHNILMGHIINSIQCNSTEDPVFQNYKQKILEQLELMKNNCLILKGLYERHEEILSETFEHMILLYLQDVFSHKLQEKYKEHEEECENNFSEAYKLQMEKIKKRIQKINFMKVLISRLLIFVNTDFGEKPDLKEMFKITRRITTIDLLLKE